MFLIRTQGWLTTLSVCLLSISAYAAEESLDNPYGLSALWAQGDWVAKTTLLILVLMSMASWYVIFTKLMDQNRVMGFAQTANASFWNAGTVQQGTQDLDAESPFRYIAEKGLEGASKHTGLLGAVDFNTWVTMSIQRAINHVQSRMQDGLAVLDGDDTTGGETLSVPDAVDVVQDRCGGIARTEEIGVQRMHPAVAVVDRS